MTMNKHEPCPLAAHQARKPNDNSEFFGWKVTGHYPIEDSTCPYCGIDMCKEIGRTNISGIFDTENHIIRLAHQQCIDNDPEWQKVAEDWNAKQKHPHPDT